MNRREFIQYCLAGTLASACIAPPGWESKAMSKRLFKIKNPKKISLDKYGGWKNINFGAAGFFKTHNDGERWWLVTPLGNAFRSFGINHYHGSWWNQDYNREYWINEFGANNAFDDKWKKGFRNRVAEDCNRLGINTLGMHTDAPLLNDPPAGPFMPYVRTFEPAKISLWRKPAQDEYPDVFSKEFKVHCDNVARVEVEPYKDDPMILGFAMADVPVYSDHSSHLFKTPSWCHALRNRNEASPGKQAWLQLIKKRYKNITVFNQSYKTGFESWNTLAKAENWRNQIREPERQELEDNRKFLTLCLDKYYSVAKSAFRRFDSNHLFFGDKLNGNDFDAHIPIEIANKYTDLLFVQCYGPWSYQQRQMDKWITITDKPVLNGDSSYAVPSEHMPNPLGNSFNWATSQEDRARKTVSFAQNAFARPEFVGWHMCGIIDTWDTMPGKENMQHAGLMTPKGEFYPQMEKAVKGISARLYQF